MAAKKSNRGGPRPGAGRPKGSRNEKTPGTRFTEKRKEVYLEALRKTGKRYLAAEAAQVSMATIRAHRSKYPEFAEAEDDAQLYYGESVVEAEIERRAIGGVKEPVYWQGVIVGHVVKRSDRLLVELARAVMPDKYGQKVKVDQSTEHRGAVAAMGLEDLRKLDPEALAKLEEVLDGLPEAQDESE